MAVRQIVQWHPNPGRGAELLSQMAEAKQIHQRLGWRVRAWQTLAAGPQPVTIAYVLESDTMSAHITAMEKGQGDAQWQSFQQRVLQSASPTGVMVFNGLTTEIAGLEAEALTTAPGSLVATVRQWQAKPGRVENLIQQSRELKPILNGLGGIVSVSQNTFAGAAVGVLSRVTVFEGLAAFRTFQEKAAASAELQALIPKMQAADAPGVLLSASLIQEIPI